MQHQNFFEIGMNLRGQRGIESVKGCDAVVAVAADAAEYKYILIGYNFLILRDIFLVFSSNF